MYGPCHRDMVQRYWARMTDSATLTGLLERFPAARVLCVGDVMLDRYVYGRADRVSAEAPVPVLRVERQAEMAGGAGNVARNLAALGVRTGLVAVVGGDPAGRALAGMLGEDGIRADLVVDESRPTTVKSRFVAAGQQLLRADDETSAPLRGAVADKLVTAAQAAMGEADVLVLSDYAKGVLTTDVLRRLIGVAAERGLPVLIDPKRQDVEAYAGAAVVKPNLQELSAVVGRAVASDSEVEEAGAELSGRLGGAAILVSRSAAGMSLIRPDAPALHLRTRAPEVFDVSGAGDTVVAVAAAAMAAGGGLAEAARLANLAGGLVVAKVGTAVVSTNELLLALLDRELSGAEAKVLSGEAALEAVKRWRLSDLKIGFTNGCFDLLHPGHVSLLAEARGHCDRLIVGLNSDASVKRLKGPDRPVQTEAARALVLASLGMVDRVVIFDDDTPIPLLHLLQPDVLIKGGDYTLAEVVGADIVQAYGGEVRLAQVVPGHSSTEVIARIGGQRAETA